MEVSDRTIELDSQQKETMMISTAQHEGGSEDFNFQCQQFKNLVEAKAKQIATVAMSQSKS
jgi:hypothetical protein